MYRTDKQLMLMPDGETEVLVKVEVEIEPYRAAVVNQDPDYCHPEEGGSWVDSVTYAEGPQKGKAVPEELWKDQAEDWRIQAVEEADDEEERDWEDDKEDEFDRMHDEYGLRGLHGSSYFGFGDD